MRLLILCSDSMDLLTQSKPTLTKWTANSRMGILVSRLAFLLCAVPSKQRIPTSRIQSQAPHFRICMDTLLGSANAIFAVSRPISRDSDVRQHAPKATARAPVPVPVVQALDVLRTRDTGLQTRCANMASTEDGRRVRQSGSAIKPIPFPDLSKLGVEMCQGGKSQERER